ncbi:MAG: DEAD/DEAH box helicase, partial [Olegusella sp.]|nr:DEAD/DEAH box helicase [Olegusella sp.]
MAHTSTAPVAFADLGLSATTLAAVDDLGYTEPTPVQAAAIPEVLAGRDLLAAAQTGTGKTAAFLLPTMDRLGHARHGRGPLMLVGTPTRELANQIEDVAGAIAAHTKHRCTTV